MSLGHFPKISSLHCISVVFTTSKPLYFLPMLPGVNDMVILIPPSFFVNKIPSQGETAKLESLSPEKNASKGTGCSVLLSSKKVTADVWPTPFDSTTILSSGSGSPAFILRGNTQEPPVTEVTSSWVMSFIGNNGEKSAKKVNM